MRKPVEECADRCKLHWDNEFGDMPCGVRRDHCDLALLREVIEKYKRDEE